jgi:hypothetical protein
MAIFSHIVYVCFCATMAHINSWDRGHNSHQSLKYLPSGSQQKTLPSSGEDGHCRSAQICISIHSGLCAIIIRTRKTRFNQNCIALLSA